MIYVAYNAPHWKYKKSTFNGGINVPLIVRYPMVAAKGTFNRSTAHVIDILPTLLDLTGTQKLEQMDRRKMQSFDGISIKPLLRGGNKQIHEYICWEHRGECAIVKGGWKMVFDHPNNMWTLYNLSRNGGVEIEDLSAQYPEKVKELMADYKQWMKENNVIPYEEQLNLPKAEN